MNKGNGPADASSALEVMTAEGGCGRPSRVRVALALSLSWTAASAVKPGTAVRRPAAASRAAAHDMTATCSWVGNSTSAWRWPAIVSAASSQPSGSAP